MNWFDQMTDWHDTYSDTKEYKYGFGLMRVETKYGYKIGHSGGMQGAAISVYHFPENDVTIIAAMNLGVFLDTDLSLKFYDIQDELLDIVFE